MTETTKNTTSRRAVAQGLAWSVPAVAAASAAPAMAATTPPPGETDPKYTFNGGIGTSVRNRGTGDTNCVTKITAMTQDPAIPGRPAGFSITEMWGEHSPTTNATVADPLEAVIAYPASFFDATAEEALAAMRTINGGSWSAPSVVVESMTTPEGETMDFYVFKWTYTGSTTQQTEPYDARSGWDGTELQVEWNGDRLNGGVLASSGCPTGTRFSRVGYFAGGYTGDWSNNGTFSTENGFDGVIPSLSDPDSGWTDGWVGIQRPF